MTDTVEQVCGSCCYYDHDTAAAVPGGLCRVQPPTRVIGTGVGQWPFVGPTDWCGQWTLNPKRARG